jgi:hypothetical protein
MRQLAAAAHAARKPQTAEQRQEIAKLGGAAIRRRRTPEQWRSIQEAGRVRLREVKQERGSYYRTEETRARRVERWREAGGGARSWQTRLRRYGLDQLLQPLKDAARRRRNGVTQLCEVCRDPARPIYRAAHDIHRRRKFTHLACSREWKRTPPGIECLKTWGGLGWIWSRVKLYGDRALKKRVREQMRAVVDHLRQPKRRGRPPTLLQDKERAIQAAIWADVDGLTTKEVADRLGLRRSTDAYGNRHGGKWTREFIKLGRVLRRVAS